MSQQPLLEQKSPTQAGLICTLRLPFPPSVNHYWRHVQLGKRRATLISKEGRDYQGRVMGEVILHQLTAAVHPDARIAVYVLLKMPDRRRRDVDNYLKSLLDAITFAQVWRDDSQIDLLTIERGELEPPGAAIVEIYRR
jgi:crossover junction endodeoxyribonuclease RusA